LTSSFFLIPFPPPFTGPDFFPSSSPLFRLSLHWRRFGKGVPPRENISSSFPPIPWLFPERERRKGAFAPFAPADDPRRPLSDAEPNFPLWRGFFCSSLRGFALLGRGRVRFLSPFHVFRRVLCVPVGNALFPLSRLVARALSPPERSDFPSGASFRFQDRRTRPFLVRCLRSQQERLFLLLLLSF